MGKIGDLKLAPSAKTEDSIAVVWEKPKQADMLVEYHIYVDGILDGSSKGTHYTIHGLKSNTNYCIMVRGVAKDGKEVMESDNISASTGQMEVVFDITDFGAIGDGKTVNTKAIQSAIDACTPFGKVYVPKGRYLTGAIYLKSDMTLYLEENAVLLGCDEPIHYPIFTYRFEGLEQPCYSSLINTDNKEAQPLKNITIAGPGKIDANGSRLRQKELKENKGKPGRAICLRNVHGVYLKDITVKQSPAWCVHLVYCQDVSINHIRVFTKRDEEGLRYQGIVNGDGIDPDSSKNVYIFDSFIASQDDCIAIKSGRDKEGRAVGIATEHVRILNCKFRGGFGVAVGSEMSGGVRDVLVQDCDFIDSFSIASVKAPRGRGGVIEDICYENCRLENTDPTIQDCEWFRGAIYMDQFYSHKAFDSDQQEEAWEGTPVIRNVTLRNVELKTAVSSAVYLVGLPEMPLENISLENVKASGKYGLKAINIKGLYLNHVDVKAQEGEPYLFHRVEKLSCKN